MNEAEINALENIRLETISQLIEKWGADKVTRVNDLDEQMVMRIVNGEAFEDLEDWVYEIVSDFTDMIVNHPSINVMVH